MANGARRRWRIRWPRLLLSIGLLLTVIGTAGAWFGLRHYYESNFQTGPPLTTARPVDPGERINVLVLGVDDEALRSDTMLVVSFDPVLREVGIVSLPRDSRVEIYGCDWFNCGGEGPVQKLGHAHAYDEDGISGPERAMRTVEQFLGIELHHYVTVRLRAFELAVDEIGGVEFDVPFRMYYYDPYQDFLIDLQPGHQLLNGRQALQLVRFRASNDYTVGYPDGDIGRIGTQQAFLRAAAAKLFSGGHIARLPAVIDAVKDQVQTDIPWERMLELAGLAARLDEDSLRLGVLPGELGDAATGYFLPDRQGTDRLVDELIRGIDRDLNSQIRLQVLNGTKRTGLATELADWLAGQGYEIALVGNAGKSGVRATEITVHTDDLPGLERLAVTIGRLAPQATVDNKAEASGLFDVTIIIGDDLQMPRR